MKIRACVAVAWSLLSFAAAAQTSFTYQGKLESAGAPAHGSADFKFRLYSAATNGALIGTELQKAAVSVSHGTFSVDLDFGDAAFLPGASRWLEIDVRSPAGSGSYTTISPRAAVNPTPLAQGLAGFAMTRAGSQSLDQNQWDGFWSFSLTDRLDITSTWESFTASKTGALTGVALDGYGLVNGNPSAMTVKIHSGVGVGGPVIGTAVVSVPQGQTGGIPVASFPNVTVTAGSKYTIEPTGTVFLVKSSGDIAGAQPGPTTANRFVFRTYVTPEATIAAKSSKAAFADAAATVDWSGIANVPTNVINSYPAWGPAPNGISYSSGNVGIGQNSPQSSLHVGGDIRIDSNYRLWFGSTTEADPVYLRRYQYLSAPDQAVLELVLGNDPITSGNTNDAFIITANGVTEFQFNTQSGGQALKAGGGSWGVLSDARAKHDVAPLDGALDRLLRLRGRTYFYNDPSLAGASGGRCTGFVAQEVEPVFPEWIGESGGMKTLNIKGFEALTVESLRQLRDEKDAQISKLRSENEARLAEKQREIDDLKRRLERVEKAISLPR